MRHAQGNLFPYHPFASTFEDGHCFKTFEDGHSVSRAFGH